MKPKLVINNPRIVDKLAARMMAAAMSPIATEQNMNEYLAYLQINALRTVWVDKLGHEHLITEGLAMLLCEMDRRFGNKEAL